MHLTEKYGESSGDNYLLFQVGQIQAQLLNYLPKGKADIRI